MKKSKPLVDKEGEVRELLIEDIRKFRPIAEVAAPSLAQKLDIQTREGTAASAAEIKAARARKRSAAARKAWQTRRQSTG